MTRSKRGPVRYSLTDDLLARPLEGLGFNNAEDAARAASALFGLGVEAEIKTYVLITRTLDNLKDDTETANKFRAALAEEKFLSEAEVELGSRSPKLSNIRTIASVAEILLRSELKPFVPSGFRPQYALAKLYDEIKGTTNEERFGALLSICKKSGGKLTIAVIEKERAELKPTEALPANAGTGSDIVSAATTEGRRFDVILFTPSQSDCERAFSDNIAEPPACLTVQASDQSLGILICHASKLSFCHRKFLRNVGFDEISRLFLLHNPQSSDVSNKFVAAVCVRGDATVNSPIGWFNGANFRLYADQISAESKNRVHVFADSAIEAGRWQCIISDANWTRG